MHAHLLHMFCNLPDVGHQTYTDNLFVSVNLAREAFMCPTKVKIHGVIWKSGHGVPQCVIQEELLSGEKADVARGAVRAAVLEGDFKSSNLVMASIYDQKPFYLLSHTTSEITWVQISKKIHSQQLRQTVNYNFLWFNMLHEYNYQMNDYDVADQLMLVYRLMRFQLPEE